ncbi:hypothetical protein AQ436_14170 [Arthrobacter sp. EpRS66]|nr:hypothetical protein AQ436_14170 [Arthrobacter sp. EpRS66]
MTLTQLGEAHWGPAPTGHRIWQSRRLLGSGDTLWNEATEALLTWRIKTRSGFVVEPLEPAQIGDRPRLQAVLGPIAIDEPIEVVDTLRSASRVGFAYRTRPGHPVRGEEAFILTRQGQEVFLEIRSLTAPSDRVCWRVAFPLLLVAQVFTRWRYGRALLPNRV